MCGISGIFDPKHTLSRQQLESGVLDMIAELGYRGPDDKGTQLIPNVGLGLGHKRLSIIDLEGGHQPMSNSLGTLSIVFNGEIYNFLEERAALEQGGYRFQTRSDTEVIIALYERYGTAAWARLRGQFAFALWDTQQQTLYLVRDRLGEKPLVWAEANGVLYFASELKALMRAPNAPRELNRSMFGLYFLMQHVPPPFTLVQGACKLPPGYFLKATAQGIETQPYWTPDTWTPHSGLSEIQTIDQFRSLFQDAVSLCTVSDVPIGTFLSGGLDSTSVTWAAQKNMPQPLHSFAIFNRENHEQHPDWTYAQDAAAHLKTNHHTIFYELQDLMNLIPDFIIRTDEPFQGPTALVSMFLSKAAREHVKVVLTGSGGDELLGGYQAYYQQVLRMQTLWQRIDRWVPYGVRDVVSALAGPLHPGFERMAMQPEDRRIAASLGYHAKWFDLICPNQAAYTGELYKDALWTHHVHMQPNYFKRYLWQDLMVDHNHAITTLPDATGMACSLEARNPFLDYKLVEFLMHVDPQLLIRNTYQNKYLLIKAMEGKIPDSILYRRKEGFSGMTEDQIVRWVRGPGRPIFRHELLDSPLVKSGYLPYKGVETLWQRFDGAPNMKEAVYYLIPIWSAAMLALWHRRILGVMR